MLYRNLGNSGIKVSIFSYGNWVNSKLDNGEEKHYEMMKFMFEKGCNFFDTAEAYDNGLGERNMGKALNRIRKELEAQRSDYVLSTKIYVGAFEDDKLPINNISTSRKHLIEGVNRSLKNLEHEYVDVLFCHRYDDETPTEEVVYAMKTLINDKKTLYWATSEWPACRIMEAIHLCDRIGCPRPIVDQCQYNLLVRKKLEDEYTPLFRDYKYGTTIWSPLASGLLTGKYNNGIPKDSRFSKVKEFYDLILEMSNVKSTEELVEKLNKFEVVSKRLNTSMHRLALAWNIKHKNVSTCILGASRIEQLKDNIEALDLLDKIDEKLEEEIDAIFNNRPNLGFNFKTLKYFDGYRKTMLYSKN